MTMTMVMDMIMAWTAITPLAEPAELAELAAAAALAVQFTLVVEEAAAAAQFTLVEEAAAAVLPSPSEAVLVEEVLYLLVVVLSLREDLLLEEDQSVLAPEPEDPLPPERAWGWKATRSTLIWMGSRRSTSQTTVTCMMAMETWIMKTARGARFCLLKPMSIMAR